MSELPRRTLLRGLAAVPALLATGCSGGQQRGPTQSPPPAGPASPTRVRRAPDWAALAADLDRRAADGSFSGAVLVADRNTDLLARGYGTADRTSGTTNSPGTRFCIASMGKMFTAVAVAQLVEQGRLAFTDPLGRYVPGFPAGVADRVTLHQLLTHTAGFGDVLRRDGDGDPPTTLSGLVERIRAEPLAFEPGTRFGYSNSGFVLLGAVVEAVAARPYADHVREHVFAPAGMADTEVAVYRPAAVPGMAHGYARVGPDGRPVPPGPGPAPASTSAEASAEASGVALRDVSGDLQVGNPSGGAWSTVTDLRRFAHAVTAGTLLGPAMITTLLAGRVSVQRPGGPAQDRYAYGFEEQVVAGTRIVGHNGGTPGYEGQLDIYPDRGLVVAVLSNQDGQLVPVVRRTEELVSAPA